MRIHTCAFSPSSQRALAYSALLCVSLIAPRVFGTESTISILRKAPLGLPRLTSEADQLGKKPVRGDAFEVLSLTTDQHSQLKARGDAPYLAIEPSSVWHRPLRVQKAGANYVTFTLNASIGSMISVGGASIVIETSLKDSSYAAIHGNGTNKLINHEVPLMLFEAARMATLDIVTIKLDKGAGTWAMWFRDTLVAEDMPLPAPENGLSEIHITAGKGGAWLCGLVCSDENPLFEDINDNGVPDDFEIKTLGKPLNANARAEVLADLRVAWQVARASSPPSEFVLTTPLPDSFPEWCAPDGAPLHGMVGALKFSEIKTN